MCDACGPLTDHVTMQVMLAAAERELILAQTDAGESVPHATRPLSAAEKRAKMRFGEIDKLQVAAADKAAKLLAGNSQVYIMAIIGAIFGSQNTLDAAQVVDAFDRLAKEPMPAAAATAADTLTENIALILEQVFAGASLIALGEATRQGGKGLPDQLEATPGRFHPHARAVALHPWTRLTSKLQSDMLTPAALSTPAVKADVLTAAKSIPLDGAEDLARQTIHTAHGQGRHETIRAVADAHGEQPASVEASELLDGETCPRCAAVDGKVYDTLAAGEVEYEQGYFGACLGGARCRGTLTVFYGFAGN